MPVMYHCVKCGRLLTKDEAKGARAYRKDLGGLFPNTNVNNYLFCPKCISEKES